MTYIPIPFPTGAQEIMYLVISYKKKQRLPPSKIKKKRGKNLNLYRIH
jgi:hypothetical protein